jgi:hypothetical protein
MIDKDQYFSISKTEEGIQPGDRCYYYYRKMVDKWKANPRWTTAHEIYKEVILSKLPHLIITDSNELQIQQELLDGFTAKQLAWQVFFIWHVVPYEKEAEERNGSI